MRIPSAILKFKQTVVTACCAVGLRDDQVVAIPGGISIPDYELSVALVVSENARVWRAIERRYINVLGDEDVKEYQTILFEDGLGRETNIAKRLAMRLAEMRIDIAIDNAA